MKPGIGELAPAFEISTYQGESIRLDAYRGEKVWLAFFRWASCPLCNMRIKELLRDYEQIEAMGVKLLAVFQSPPEKIARYVATQNPPFPLIADPEMRLYEAYGVDMRWTGLFYPRVVWRTLQATANGLLSLDLGDWPLARVPSDLLIDPEGLIYDRYDGVAISDHIPLDRVARFSDDLCLDMAGVDGK